MSSLFLRVAEAGLDRRIRPWGQVKGGSQVKPAKGRISCQYPHLAEIQDMESISGPPLPKEICNICQDLSPEDFSQLSLIKPFLAENMSDEKAWQKSLESAYGPSPVKPVEASTLLSSS